jgi:glutathione synthase/RimK-type ligase-like ATP-grasp enzyme
MSNYVAIHFREGGYAKKWIEFCKKESIQFKIVDCYSNEIISELKGVTHLLWHYNRWEVKNGSIANKLLSIFEIMGITVFPNLPTRLGFDEKIVQKYLLESIAAPMPKTFVFFDKQKALSFTQNDKDLVFKLSKGAGSKNVKLVNREESQILISKMFKKGLNSFAKQFPNFNKSFLFSLKRYFLYRRPLVSHQNRIVGKEYNYVYFQEFLPNNNHDIRIITFKDKALGIKRQVAKGTFKASGSGILIYDYKEIPLECIEKAFQVSGKLNFQCMAYDFVFNPVDGYQIVEICHGVSARSYEKCEGFWDKDLNFNVFQSPPIIEEFILQDLLNLKYEI